MVQDKLYNFQSRITKALEGTSSSCHENMLLAPKKKVFKMITPRQTYIRHTKD